MNPGAIRGRIDAPEKEAAMSESLAGELDARFSDPDATPTAWASARAVLDDARIAWIATTRRDGRPHVTPVVFVWSDDAPHFCTGPDEQKHKNLDANPSCLLLTGANTYEEGLDVVVEGEAVRVADDARLHRLADAFTDKYGEDWRFEVRDGRFHHGGGPATVFRIECRKALGFARGTAGQTRWRPGSG